MRFVIRWVLFLASIGLIGMMACTRFDAFDPRINEGLIEYQVTFPYLEDESNMMASLLPDKMLMHFKTDQYSTELATIGGLFKNRFVSNQSELTLIHQLKIFKKKLDTEYNETGVRRQLQTMPQLTIIETNEIDTVAGFRCKKAIGIFDHISLPEMTIFYTDEIKIDNPNWCTQFHPIEGVMLQYEVEQLGIRMRFRAVSVQSLEVTDSQLKPETGYERVSSDRLQVEIEQLLTSFNM